MAVIGGGYGGVAVARGLDRRAQVTLVEPRDAFAHNIASLRSLVHPEWAHNMYFPYDRLLEAGQVLHDRAVEVEVGRVVLASGTVLEPDIVVVATGSRYPYPAKPCADEAEAALRQMLATHAELARSDRILIVGAGAVGVELAAEIKIEWPGKAVLLLDAAGDVLSGTAHSEQLRAELRRQLGDLGVELRLGCPLESLPTAVPARRAEVEAVTVSGERLHADMWFRCFGVAPCSDLLGGALRPARRADGTIQVDDLLRIAGQPRAYALGDVADVDAKMAGLAMIQASVVVANIKAQIRGDEPTRRYEPIGPMIMVAIGPDGGAGESPAGLHHGAEVAEMKGRDLLTGYFGATFGLDRATPG